MCTPTHTPCVTLSVYPQFIVTKPTNMWKIMSVANIWYFWTSRTPYPGRTCHTYNIYVSWMKVSLSPSQCIDVWPYLKKHILIYIHTNLECPIAQREWTISEIRAAFIHRAWRAFIGTSDWIILAVCWNQRHYRRQNRHLHFLFNSTDWLSPIWICCTLI